MKTRGSDDELRKVIDPGDRPGFKNRYFDAAHKFHLMTAMKPGPSDVLLDIGCGVGRLSEFFADKVNRVLAIDIADEFIRLNRKNPRRHTNVDYLFFAEAERIRDGGVTKAYIDSVLMYCEKDEQAVELLAKYVALLSPSAKFFVMEPTQRNPEVIKLDGAFHARYRNISQFRAVFEKAGLRVLAAHPAPERSRGPLVLAVTALRPLYQRLPTFVRAAAPLAFHLDRFTTKLPGVLRITENRLPVDTLFVLERS